MVSWINQIDCDLDKEFNEEFNVTILGVAEVV